MKRYGIIVAAALIAATGLTSLAARSEEPRLGDIKRTHLMKEALSVPGREVVQVRVDFPPGVVAVRHSHPGEELVYMIEGELEYRLDGRPPVILKAGDVLLIPHGVHHAVTNVGSGNAAELATYIVETGKPLLTLGR
ncbi:MULTISPECIES: cupin domain-containing protein [Bradyrhizobium]|jgi:quercetin dioxygenase-like cupin family protein|uniref:cupin domain-containing protein n=1 Tax=Bradyrhizobium TaxID=374 RepID=UPI0004076736|nr:MULTISPECIES: cupin domain-containing protein [Bradyrhizobium]WLB87283.1 cupin domain-containing protein [Bradyrhizobium japonicum USDA 135]GLR94690.1 cupin [Bradyrhizobium liaoningense]